jgi:single-strand DNA-binding protein
MNITVKGNVGSDPELKFSKNNTAYVSFSVAYTPRTKDGDNWVDGETMWFRVVQFGVKAEATTDMIKKGDAVIVNGTMKQSTFTDKEGKERTSLEITASDIGLVPRLVKNSKQSTENQIEGAFPW